MSGSYRHIEHLKERENPTRPPKPTHSWIILAIALAALGLWWWLS